MRGISTVYRKQALQSGIFANQNESASPPCNAYPSSLVYRTPSRASSSRYGRSRAFASRLFIEPRFYIARSYHHRPRSSTYSKHLNVFVHEIKSSSPRCRIVIRGRSSCCLVPRPCGRAGARMILETVRWHGSREWRQGRGMRRLEIGFLKHPRHLMIRAGLMVETDWGRTFIGIVGHQAPIISATTRSTPYGQFRKTLESTHTCLAISHP